MDDPVMKLADATLQALAAIEERQNALRGTLEATGRQLIRQQRVAARDITDMLRALTAQQREIQDELRRIHERLDAVEGRSWPVDPDG